MQDNEIADLAEALIGVAHQAGRAALSYYGDGLEVRRKADSSPVTDADHAAEDIILEALSKIVPEVPVIAEEAVAAGRVPETGTRLFLVDPLDGTKEFIAGNGEFTVNIALADHGTPRFGLVYAPALGQLFVTLSETRAIATMLDAHGAPPRLAALEHIPLATREPPLSGLVAAISRSHLNVQTEDFLRSIGVTERIVSGSSLKFCVIAQGRADVYPRLGPTNEWDTGAGHAVLRAAGGLVLAEDGAPLRYGKSEVHYRNPGFIAWGRPPQLSQGVQEALSSAP